MISPFESAPTEHAAAGPVSGSFPAGPAPLSSALREQAPFEQAPFEQAPFEQALQAESSWMEYDDGTWWELPVRRWRRHSDHVDDLMLSRCNGPTLDVGCGPGRLTVALLLNGSAAIGIDTSAAAVRMTVGRGGLAVLRDVFGPVPGEGRWHHVLLADGNLGIGGDPKSLLTRVHELLRPGGSAVVEVARPGTGLDCRLARIEHGPWFWWSEVGVEAMEQLADATGFRLTWQVERAGRWFVELERP